MPYDVSLDQCLFSKTYENELGRLTVGVHSYNNGAKKIASESASFSTGGIKKYGLTTCESILVRFIIWAIKTLREK